MLSRILNSEQTGGLLLIACTALSLLLANSAWGPSYHYLWQTTVAGGHLEYWINDGLMAIFFLYVGLELKKEIKAGELANLEQALLPVFAAVGGMVVPAGIYLLLNYGTGTQKGAGIPMATDIAFALGILSLLGSRVPASIKVFLTALAAFDDVGAIMIIAVFYTSTLVWANLLWAAGALVLLVGLNLLKVRSLLPYLVVGTILWWCMLHSGVHATIAGVLTALCIPFIDSKGLSPVNTLLHSLHRPVTFFILPLFALVNTAITLQRGIGQALSQHYSIGIALGLIVGKPLGIVLLSLLAIKLKISKLPPQVNNRMLWGVGLLGGIGFTISIFITLLAFQEDIIISNSKLVILLSSLISGILGYTVLRSVTGPPKA